MDYRKAENHNNDNKHRAFIYAALSFSATLVLCLLFISVTIINRSTVERLMMERLILEKSMKIDDVISKLLYKTEALSAFVIHADDHVDDFNRIASAIADDPAILNMLIAPEGIVSDVYPLEGNEAVLGLNFFEEGAGNREAVMAKETGRLVLGGPFNLIQGGQALVGRLPVYADSPNGEKRFWGLVSVTLRYPEALNGAGLGDIEKDGLSYIIWRINPDDNQRQIIAKGERYNSKHLRYIEKHIRILNANWYFRIAPIRVWYEYAETWVLVFAGLSISLLVAFVVRSNIVLRDAKNKLEEKIREKANLEEALTATQQQAEHASMAKSSFLANVNHEIRTPMSGIVGFAELAADGGVEPAAMKEYLDKIKDSAEGLLGIIENMLDISKIESGNITIEKVPFDINDTIAICGALSNLKAIEKGITLATSVEPAVTEKVLGDPVKLLQVLMSLLSNAVKFTSSGFVSLTAAVSQIEENKLGFEFKVRDSGIGITAEQMSYIFEPFTQADNTMTRRYGGSGLGLAIAKNMLALMGSELEVESSPGKGSTFSFRLTLETTGEPIEQSKSIASQKPLTFSGTILVCEDNETNQLVIRNHLEKMGLNVFVASDGKSGVDKVQQHMRDGAPFDLIFMDIHMPVMDGIDAVERLKELGSKTPIIAITANVDDADLEEYKKHGMDTCLGKPYTGSDLRKCIMKYISPVETDENTYIDLQATAKKASAIDAVVGLEQCGGDKPVYEEILKNFLKNNKQLLDNFNSALSAGDIKLAHRTVHSLRGASGTIGASRLAEAALNVEKALSEVLESGKAADVEVIAGGSLTDCIDLFENEFGAVLAELNSLLAEESIKAGATSVVDREKTLELIRNIAPYLETGDSKSLEYLSDIENAFLPIAEKYKLFITQMENYDFDLALETLKSISEFMRA